MNTRVKGMMVERLAVKQLEAAGFLVHRVKGSTKFNANVDIFNLFDILAVKRLVEYTEAKLIQVKTHRNSAYGKLLSPYKAFAEQFKDAFSVEVWVYQGKEQFKVIKL